MTLFVCNLQDEVDQGELKELFAAYGKVSRVHLCLDRASRRIAFVDMPNEVAAESAAAGLHGHYFCNKRLVVREANARKPRAETFAVR